MDRQDLCIVHTARLDDRDAYQTLCQTTQVIATQGLSQIVMLVDECRGFPLTWSATLSAEVRPVLCYGLSMRAKVRALRAEFEKVAAERTLYAVHLHGVEICLLGSRALRGMAVPGRVLYSPRRAHMGPAWSGGLLRRLLQNHVLPSDYAPVAGSFVEAEALSKLLNRSAEVLPQPVSDVFFAVNAEDEHPPSVVVHGSRPESVDVATRLCVLVNGRDTRIRFRWLGAPPPNTKAKLDAASVELVEAPDDAGRAQALSRASAFIDLSLADETPAATVQAMAAGVPCLVSDTRAQRALIRHGETGFICTSDRDFVERLILLLRDAGERKRVGEAARAEAERWFSRRHFESALLRAYGLAKRTKPRPVLTIAATATGTHAR